MGLLDKVKDYFGFADAAEWDANDPAGDESLYDGKAVEANPYDHEQFEGGK